MKISKEFIRAVWDDFRSHHERVKAAGGIPLKDVVDGKQVPAGWTLDVITDYFVPPHFSETVH